MDKSEDLWQNVQNVWNIQNIERNRKIEDDVTDHKYHTHSNKQFPLATKTQPLLSHTAFILTPLAIPNNVKQCKMTQFLLGIYMQGLNLV